MSDSDAGSRWLRLTGGVALVVIGVPFLLGPVAPVVVLFLVLALYALLAERSRPSQRWKAPAAAIGALAATVTVDLLAGEFLPGGAAATAAVVGGAATTVGVLLAVRSARAL